MGLLYALVKIEPGVWVFGELSPLLLTTLVGVCCYPLWVGCGLAPLLLAICWVDLLTDNGSISGGPMFKLIYFLVWPIFNLLGLVGLVAVPVSFA